MYRYGVLAFLQSENGYLGNVTNCHTLLDQLILTHSLSRRVELKVSVYPINTVPIRKKNKNLYLLSISARDYELCRSFWIEICQFFVFYIYWYFRIKYLSKLLQTIFKFSHPLIRGFIKGLSTNYAIYSTFFHGIVPLCCA